ncbi:hypothetical protein SESBI_42344 [Sesbania bispinosa]|nr:hypothetical protein SESBI_42344 [Sesbania bispinosa]
MESISKAIEPGYKKHAYGEFFGGSNDYASIACVQGDYHNGDGDSSFALVAYREGDDDDDDVYDYAPAA